MANVEPRNSSLAFLFLVFASLLWSSAGVMIKWISWNPLSIAGMRSAISSLFLLFFLRKPQISWSFEQAGGALSYALTVILFVSATKLTTAANAILLQYTAPIYTALFSSWYLNERAYWYDWFAVVVVFGGIALFFMDNLTGGGYLGNVIAVLSGVTTAWLTLFLRKQKHASPLESVFLGNIFTAVVGLPFMFGSSLSFTGWLGILFLGIFQLGLSFVLYSAAIKKVRALDAILVGALEPILNPLWTFLFLRELPGFYAFIGGGIVVVSVTLRSVFSIISARKH